MSTTSDRLHAAVFRIGRWRIVWMLGYASGAGSLWATQHRSNPLAYVVLAVVATGILAVAARRVSSAPAAEDTP